MSYLFDLPAVPSLTVHGESARFPVHRIFCVGRNYAAHAVEMGDVPSRAAPFYFTKHPHAVLASGSALTYPPGTQDFQYEMELVIALGAPVFRCSAPDARAAIYAYGCGLDMTRRDLQQAGKDKRRPWDLGKDVEGSAVLTALTKAETMGEIGPQRIHLEVNGTLKQEATLADMIHSVDEIVADLSRFYHLVPGDLIMTGTPAGVGPVVPGDKITGGIDGLDPIALTVDPPE